MQSGIDHFILVKEKTQHSIPSHEDQKNNIDDNDVASFIFNNTHKPIQEIVLEYLGGAEIKIDDDLDRPKETESKIIENLKNLTIFGKSNNHFKAIEAAHHLLANDSKRCLSLVKHFPLALVCEVTVVLESSEVNKVGPCNKVVRGNLIQIAAMYLKNSILNDLKNQALSHCLLSEEEIEKQIFNVILSENAKMANEERNTKILEAVQEFADNIVTVLKQPHRFNKELYEELTEEISEIDRIVLNEALEKFRNLLRSVFNKPITCGYVPDFEIMYQTLKWFYHNDVRFHDRDEPEGWTTAANYFLIFVCGSLQHILGMYFSEGMKNNDIFGNSFFGFGGHLSVFSQAEIPFNHYMENMLNNLKNLLVKRDKEVQSLFSHNRKEFDIQLTP